MTRRLAAALLVLLTTATSLSAALAGPASAADPVYGAPVVGQCSDLSPGEREEASYGEAPVDCAGPHTAQVIAVVQLPDRLDLGSRGLEVFALRSCYAAQEQALGAPLRQVRFSTYDVAWFVPDADQQAAGARWVRCELVLPSGRRLEPLPQVPALGERPLADEVARCMTRTRFRAVVCADDHDFRMVRALTVRGERFRDVRGWARLGMDRCRLPSGRTPTAFAWPTRAAWRAGDRSLLCFDGERP